MGLNDPREIPYEFRTFQFDGEAWLVDWSSRSYPCTATPHVWAQPVTDRGHVNGALFIASTVERRYGLSPVEGIDPDDLGADVAEDVAWDAALDVARDALEASS